MLVKDEADIIEDVLRHALWHVDHVIVSDNMSTDGTWEIVNELALQQSGRVTVERDEQVAYQQSRKTTRLARIALEAGYNWVVPMDADEIWYALNGTRLVDYLDGHARDVMIVTADLYDHLPTALDDPSVVSPVRRIGWRLRQHGSLPKVACRCRPDLVIEMGNHSARTRGTGLSVPGLAIRHFSWRSPEQYVRKIRNGQAAYAASNLPETFGRHWRMWKDQPDEALVEHFHLWFHSDRPHDDASLVCDPAPVMTV